MSFPERLQEYVAEHQWGILQDLLFALAWVGFVVVFFAVVDGPQWAYYMFLLAGIPAYYGFVYSWKMAREQQRQRNQS